MADERIGAFLALRALKLVRVKAAALGRTVPGELGVLVSAWLKCFNPGWQPQGINPASLTTALGRIQAALPREPVARRRGPRARGRGGHRDPTGHARSRPRSPGRTGSRSSPSAIRTPPSTRSHPPEPPARSASRDRQRRRRATPRSAPPGSPAPPKPVISWRSGSATRSPRRGPGWAWIASAQAVDGRAC